MSPENSGSTPHGPDPGERGASFDIPVRQGGGAVVEMFNRTVAYQITPLYPLLVEAIRKHDPDLIAFLAEADTELSVAGCYNLDDEPQRQIVTHGLRKPTIETVPPYSHYWHGQLTARTYFALGTTMAVRSAVRRELRWKELYAEPASGERPVLETLGDAGETPAIVRAVPRQVAQAYTRYENAATSFFQEACTLVGSSRATPLQLQMVLDTLHPSYQQFSVAPAGRTVSPVHIIPRILPVVSELREALEGAGLPRSDRARARQAAAGAVVNFAERFTAGLRKPNVRRYERGGAGLQAARAVSELALRATIGFLPEGCPNATPINGARRRRLEQVAHDTFAMARVPDVIGQAIQEYTKVGGSDASAVQGIREALDSAFGDRRA